jgi:hypothetical protein
VTSGSVMASHPLVAAAFQYRRETAEKVIAGVPTGRCSNGV